jgi:hypothetical protein
MNTFESAIAHLLDIAKKTNDNEIKNIGMGFFGENVIREHLKKKEQVYDLMQVDIIFQPRGGIDYRLAEIKCQERFIAPPFDGHGLPEWQIKSRLAFERRKKIEAWIYIIEPSKWIDSPLSEKIIYKQSIKKLNDLPANEKFKTHRSSRIIFPIERFEKVVVSESADCLKLFKAA